MENEISNIHIKNKTVTMRNKINKLELSLKSEVFGQDQAVEAICDKVVETCYNIPTDTPRAIYFFLGPPATGKTMLSKLLSKYLNGYKSFNIFDMTQYISEYDSHAFFGISKGYKSAAEGKLTKFVKKNPKSILVFDEIEKAHTSVLSGFLSLLSSGEVKDNYTDEVINFRETIVVFTSNLGSELYNNHDFIELMQQKPRAANSTILEVISREKKIEGTKVVKAIAPEMLSRLSQGQIVLFNKLPFTTLLNLVKEKILEVEKNFKKEYDIEIQYNSFEAIIALQILSFAPLIDIRKLKSKLPLLLFDPITDFIRKNTIPITLVKFSMDKSSSDMLKKELFYISNDKQLKFLHDLFRKNETFTCKMTRSHKNNILDFKFSNVTRKKLRKSIDFEGEDALVFEVPSISFKDIFGHKVAKRRLLEIVNILKNPKKLEQFDVEVPKGMLLHGVSGTGKTMLAKAFANEAGLPFIQTTGSEILDINLMRKIFKKAREYAPSIVFIDEIDAIGTRDGSEKDILINQLLVEIKGFKQNTNESVFIIAATNIKNKIDPAILSSGRIDLHIAINTLDREAREFFIDKILKKPTQGEFNKEKILTYTAGMTGADLEKVARESFLYVFRNSLDAITQDILIEQINTIKYGTRVTYGSIDKLLVSTTIHESGHAIISKILMPTLKIEQITVTPRNHTLGFVSYDSDKNFTNLTRKDIKSKLCVAFAGREAQLKEYGEAGFDGGASSDLKKATKMAYYAIAILGMGEKTGYINVTDNELFSKDIEAEVKTWLNEAQQTTKKLVQKHWNKIKKLAKLLEKKEMLNEEEILNVLETA